MSDIHPFLLQGKDSASNLIHSLQGPLDNSPHAQVYLAEPAQIEAALATAASAFPITRSLPTYARADLLERVRAALRDQAEEFAQLITRETAKPIRYARAEVERAVATFTDAWRVSLGERGEWLPLDWNPASQGRSALVRRVPRGPLTAITPFNFPLNLVAHKIAPALVCGCPILLKPAPQAPLTALRLARLILSADSDRILPPGALQVLPCENDVAQPLITDERVKFLTFTGSAAVGWKLKHMADNKPAALELGGNAAVLIEPDADLSHAAERCAQGGFAFAGQSCISVQRIYVHQSVGEEFARLLVEKTRALKVGNPLEDDTEVGPMISIAEAERAESWVREAGGEVLLGGERQGAYFPPTILRNVRENAKVICEEIFAPVVIIETYDDFAYALARADSTRYGLQAGLFTHDQGKVAQAFSALEVGALVVNDVPTYRADVMPYGGVKDSGLGREGVAYALEEMTVRKTLVYAGF